MSKQTVEAECSSCGGTGLYSGMCEGPGVAVICIDCEGTGCEKIKYTPFTGRKLRKDIKTVRASRGKFIATGVGPKGKKVTYSEFLAGKRP